MPLVENQTAASLLIRNTNSGEAARQRRRVNGENVRLMFNIVPEAAVYLGDRDIASIARSTVFNTQPDAICVSGLTAGAETSQATLNKVKEAVPNTPVFANTGVNVKNVAAQLAVSDGAVVGTYFKRDGYIWNDVDRARVVHNAVCALRGSSAQRGGRSEGEIRLS